MSGIDAKPADDAAVDETFDARQLESMSDARLKAEIRRYTPPGAQEPPASTEPAMSAEMDAAGNVRMEAHLTPADRAVLRRTAQEQAATHAETIGNPQGLRGLFPTNVVRWRAVRLPTPIRTPRGD